MRNQQKVITLLTALTLITFFWGCNPGNKNSLFEKMSGSRTGIEFENNLEYDRDFNIYQYRNFYNGGGVAIGDINNDGLMDVYFTANMDSNRLYLNKGNFQFEDITSKAGVWGDRAWSTGVSMADVNGDDFAHGFCWGLLSERGVGGLLMHGGKRENGSRTTKLGESYA